MTPLLLPTSTKWSSWTCAMLLLQRLLSVEMLCAAAASGAKEKEKTDGGTEEVEKEDC